MFRWTKICALVLLYNVKVSSAFFEHCKYSVYNSDPNKVHILTSPSYPDLYQPNTSCFFKFTVPQDYEIVADCTLALPKGETSCTTDFFFISLDGDEKLNGAEQICGSGNLTRTSLFNKMVLAYTSSYRSPGGRIFCKLSTRPQACNCGWYSQTRIVGGEPATQFEYPSVVSLRLKRTNEQICGGTIINHRYIATAAHCTLFFGEPENVLILAGYYSTNGTSQFARIYEAQKFINHPEYIDSTNDIALIKTETPMEWSRFIGPMCLPFDFVHNGIADYARVYVVGWGTTSFAGPLSKTLQTADVYVLPNSQCQTYGLQPSELCTFNEGKDACQRDSGGPVVLKGSVREYLVGIISRGLECSTSAAINTRVTSYIKWIYQTTNGSLCYKPFY